MTNINMHSPRPWRYAESKSGYWYLYDAVGEVIFVDKVTKRTKNHDANMRLIVAAVNSMFTEDDDEV